MSPELINESLAAVESKPFTISVLDGRQFNVPHTDYLMVTDDGEQVILLADGKSLKIIDTEHITSIEFDRTVKGGNKR